MVQGLEVAAGRPTRRRERELTEPRGIARCRGARAPDGGDPGVFGWPVPIRDMDVPPGDQRGRIDSRCPGDTQPRSYAGALSIRCCARPTQCVPGSWPAWLGGSSWNVECSTSKCPARQPCSSSSSCGAWPSWKQESSSDDVRRQRRQVRGHRPDVQVVHVDDVRQSRAGARAPSARSTPSGAASSSTRPESRSSPQAAQQHQRDDQSEAIGSARSKPGGQDDDAGDHRAEEAVEVGEDVLVGALDVRGWCGWPWPARRPPRG